MTHQSAHGSQDVFISLQLDDSAEVFFGIRVRGGLLTTHSILLLLLNVPSFTQTCAVMQQSGSTQIR